jgi:hypothetical protein
MDLERGGSILVLRKESPPLSVDAQKLRQAAQNLRETSSCRLSHGQVCDAIIVTLLRTQATSCRLRAYN